MAFEDLVRFLGDLYDVAVVDPGDTHSHERGDRQADFGGIDLCTIAGDDVSVFELADALDDGGRGQTNASAKLCVARSSILLEFLQYFAVNFVDHRSRRIISSHGG